MGTYHQNSAYVEGAASMGHSVLWYTDTAPVQALTLESPSGPGDELVRSEIYIQAGYWTFGTSSTSGLEVIAWPNVYAALEVYSVGAGGFPDPRAATQRVQNRSAFAMPGHFYLDHNGNPAAQAVGSTGGYITSKGRRTPNQYGSGHPEARVGLWTSNIGTGWLAVGTGQGTWSISLSCLWFTP